MSIINPLPYNIINGTPIDAVPVMADFNWIVSQVNANVAASLPSNTSSIPTYVPAADVAGAANAITLAPTPPIGAYAAGQRFSFPAKFANSTATTIATSGLAVRALKYEDGSAMTGQELVANGIYDVIDNGTNYVLLNASQGTGILTFTPGIAFSGAAVGVTYAFRAASYMKIGRMLHFTLDVLLSNKGSSAGSLQLTGLPYAASSAWPTGSLCTVPIMVSNLGFSGGTAAYVMGMVSNAAGIITVFTLETSTGLQNITNGSVTNTSNFVCSGAYPV